MNILERYKTNILLNKETNLYIFLHYDTDNQNNPNRLFISCGVHCVDRAEAIKTAKNYLYHFNELDNLAHRVFKLLGCNVGDIEEFQNFIIDNPHKTDYELQELWLRSFYFGFVPNETIILVENVRNPFYNSNVILGQADNKNSKLGHTIGIKESVLRSTTQVSTDNVIHVPSNLILPNGDYYNFILGFDSNKGKIVLTCINSNHFNVLDIDNDKFYTMADILTDLEPAESSVSNIGIISIEYVVDDIIEFSKLLLTIGRTVQGHYLMYTNNPVFSSKYSANSYVNDYLRKI